MVTNFCFATSVLDIQPTDYVTDYTQTLSSQEVLELSKILGNLEQQKKISVAVVMVPSLTDEFGRSDYIEHFAVKLYEKLKIGSKEKDEGLLWIISKDTREMRMEVGYGLEPVFTDGITKIIQDNFVRPEFKQNNYYAGLKIGIEKIDKVVNEDTTSYAKGWDENLSKGDLNGLIIFFFIAFLNFGTWIISVLGRTKEWYVGGLIGFFASGAIAYVLFGIALGSVFAVTIVTISGFLLDYFVSKNYLYHLDNPSKRGRPDFWAGGTWGPGSGGFGRGGSGFGGFGGGGSSGGGGSNSSW